jgi:hypothetical protein
MKREEARISPHGCSRLWGPRRAHARWCAACVVTFPFVLGFLGCGGETPSGPTSTSTSTSTSSSTNEPAGASAAASSETTAVPAGALENFLTSGARRGVSADGTYRVAWEPVGGVFPDAEPFAIAIEVERVDGRELGSDVALAADAEMPHHGHGMNLVPVVKPAPGRGRFIAEGMLLHMPGRWIVAIDVEESGVAERAHWIIDVE